MNMFAWLRSRYTSIVIFIGLFLVFDLSVLVLDTFITEEIKHDASAVNMAGRQRMLSQRTSKIIFQIQNDARVHKNHAIALDELRTTVGLFDSTLNAFANGGEVIGGKGGLIFLKAVESPVGQNILSEAFQIWNPLKILLEPVITSTASVPNNNLAQVSDFIRKNNLDLLRIMNDLTSEREESAAAKAHDLRLVQMVAMVFSTINFGFILFYFIKKLRQSDEQTREFSENLLIANNDLESAQNELLTAKEQTDEILETVGEGLFLFSEDGFIGHQYSSQLESIFPDQPIAGVKFLELMKPLLSQKDWGLTQDYQKLLFQKRLKESMLLNVNPLDKVDVTFDSGDGIAINKILAFRFNRVFDHEKNIRHILVTVQDVTQQVMLARRLDEQKEQAKQQIELLYHTIQVEPETLKNFLDETTARLESVNSMLKSAQEGKWDLRMVVEHIFRDIHSLKGDSALLGLELFEQASHRIEEELVHLRAYPDLSGEHFVKLTLGIDEIRKYLSDTVSLIERMSTFRSSMTNLSDGSTQTANSRKSNRVSNNFVQDVAALATRIARDEGREIAIDSTHFDPDMIPTDKLSEFKDLLIQLVRNAIVHGIESPEERKQKMKSTTGILRLATEPQGDYKVDLIVRDDGRGIDLNSIRKKARENGLCTAEQLKTMNNSALAALIFEPGFSTANSVDVRAGRGIGMDIVKEKVREMGGQLRLAYSPDRFSEFRISLPANAA